MLKTLLLLPLLVGLASGCTAQNKKNPSLTIVPKAGYSSSSLNFSIAGTTAGTNPNILSELKWKNISAFVYGADIELQLTKRFIVEAGFSRSHTAGGNVSDIDYAEDNRSSIFSELYAGSHKGYSQAMDIHAGYLFWERDNVTLKGYIGYRHLTQKLYIVNRKRSTSESDMYYQEGLNSYYKTNWHMLGSTAELGWRAANKLHLSYRLGGYFCRYNAYGDWNLRNEFAHPKSYTHKDAGYRLTNQVVVRKAIGERTGLQFSYSYDVGKTKNGHDILYLNNSASLRTRLNEVRTAEHRLDVGIAYQLLPHKSRPANTGK